RIESAGIVGRRIGLIHSRSRGSRTKESGDLGQTGGLHNSCKILDGLSAPPPGSVWNCADKVVSTRQPIEAVGAKIIGLNLSGGDKRLRTIVLILIGERLHLYTGDRFSRFVAHSSGNRSCRNHRDADAGEFLSSGNCQSCTGSGNPRPLTIFLSDESIAFDN